MVAPTSVSRQFQSIQARASRWHQMLLGLSAAFLAMAAFAADPGKKGSTAPQQDSLVVALSTLGNESLDPIGGPSFNKQYMQLLFDPLIGSDAKDESASKATGIARDWQVSADGKTVTFLLREGVRFSNGEELTADDVKFSLERLGRKDNLTPFGGTITQAIERIETPSKYRVVVTLKAPSFAFLQLLTPLASGTESMIVSKKYFETAGLDKFRTEPVGTGPYRLVERRSGSQMVFEARDDHFAAGRPRFKRVTLRLIPEETTRIAQLRTGQVDLADVSRENIDSLKQAGMQIFTKPAGDVLMVYFQLHKPESKFRDPRVREAISLAINREELNKFLFKGYGSLAATFAPRSAIGYKALSVDPYDPEKSKRLLQEAGVKPGDLSLQFQAFSFNGWPEQREAANALATYWEKIGLKSTIIFRDYATYRAEWRDKKLPEPAVTLHPQPGTPLPVGLFNAELRCGGLLPITCDPKLDELIARLNAAVNEREYIVAYQEIEQTLRDNRYIIPLLEAGTVMAGNRKIRSDYSVGMGYLGINL
ncbi:MAG: ABC transporter substrate-binding protein, partial [Burkholderiales bacterium]